MADGATRLATLAGHVAPVRPDDAGPHLVVIVERDCPTSRGALQALAAADVPATVVSQGRHEAARDLVRSTGADGLRVLVEPAPHDVSAAFDARTVPTFLLLDEAGGVTDRCEGWDRDRVGALVAAVGGRLDDDGDMPPHKPGCQSRSTFDAATLERLEQDDARLDGGRGGSIDDMWELGWTDGLPTVPPTPGRVEAMLDGRDGGEVLGRVGPVDGELTRRRLAACAVLAGCAPTAFPVVEAAALAALDPAFNLHGQQNTTHFASPVVVVNGPVREQVGLHGGSNVLGPGFRANATIGRALRLMMQLTGGGSPGGLDQSTLGGPHKFGLCFPEREERSPWEPLHVTLGYAADDSTVTLLAGETPAGVSDHYSRTPEALATTLTLAVERAWAPAWYPLGTQTLLIVCPEHADSLAQAGWSKQDLRRYVFEHSHRTAAELRATGSGELTPFVEQAESGEQRIGKFLDEEELVIVVAGGDAGRFSAVIGPWVGFGLGSTMVTRRIDT